VPLFIAKGGEFVRLRLEQTQSVSRESRACLTSSPRWGYVSLPRAGFRDWIFELIRSSKCKRLLSQRICKNYKPCALRRNRASGL